MKTAKEELKRVLVTDCGSTTTKALLFEKTDQGWRKTSRGEAPTTVEQPVADVTVGALNAFKEVQELRGVKLLSDEEQNPFIESSSDSEDGLDLYLSTSSAGGGLQMIVAGVVKNMTAESAERAALGAGAIVLDVLSADDGREDYERIDKIRHLKPDIVLITGGTDGGSRNHVIEMAESLLAAAPRPRFGDTLKLPVIYAGNTEAAEEVEKILSSIAQISVVDNVRSELESENLQPAREAIHELFLEHVMSHSPGYGKLMSWSPVPVMPTPAAVGDMIQSYAEQEKRQVLCADIGGATTDLFSVFQNQEGRDIFNRTVSANLGMSYSIANVLIEAGVSNIARWLPYEISEHELRDRLRNKMIRPTSIPQTLEDLWLEQGVCREALRLSLEHHRSLAVGLSGIQQKRGIADLFSQKQNRYELVDMMQLDIAIGSGGVLSHAPERMQAASMILDGFGLQGVTEIAVDSVFMIPHLGVFASVHPEAASEIFVHDCLVRVCHAIVPVFESHYVKGEKLAELQIDGEIVGEVVRGVVSCLDYPEDTECEITVTPLNRHINVGSGSGQIHQQKILTGQNGFILDGRNSPVEFSEGPLEKVKRQQEIFNALGLSKGGTD